MEYTLLYNQFLNQVVQNSRNRVGANDVPGIMIVHSTYTSSPTINAMDTSMIGLQYVYTRHGEPLIRSGSTIPLLIHGMN